MFYGGRTYQHCTPACIKALKIGNYHPGCPNVLEHRSAHASIGEVLEDAYDLLRTGNGVVDLLGGGNSAKCFSVRTHQGYQFAVKIYGEKADPNLFKHEVRVYEHLSKLQGASVPVILDTPRCVFDGTMSNMIFMSYGGDTAEKNHLVTSDVVDRLFKALSDIHSLGVYLEDLSLRNILIDKIGRVVIIDHESSDIRSSEAESIKREQEADLEACERVKRTGDMKFFKSEHPDEQDEDWDLTMITGI